MWPGRALQVWPRARARPAGPGPLRSPRSPGEPGRRTGGWEARYSRCHLPPGEPAGKLRQARPGRPCVLLLLLSLFLKKDPTRSCLRSRPLPPARLFLGLWDCPLAHFSPLSLPGLCLLPPWVSPGLITSLWRPLAPLRWTGRGRPRPHAERKPRPDPRLPPPARYQEVMRVWVRGKAGAEGISGVHLWEPSAPARRGPARPQSAGMRAPAL